MSKYALVDTDDTILEFRDYAEPPVAVTSSDIKPRLLPVELDDVVFDPVSEVREGPTYIVEAARVVERYTKRLKNAQEIADMKAAKLAAVNAEADVRLALVALTPQQQIRALSRLVNLLYRHTDITSWPAAQQTAVTTNQAKLDSIDGVRAKEETKLAEVNALTTAAQIAAYDVTTGW